MTAPYTHQAHAARCGEAARQCVMLAPKCVQVRRGRVVYCAQIVEPYTHVQAGDCWSVELLPPHGGRMTVLVRHVRECEGIDGRCLCASDRAAARSPAEDGRAVEAVCGQRLGNPALNPDSFSAEAVAGQATRGGHA